MRRSTLFLLPFLGLALVFGAWSDARGCSCAIGPSFAEAFQGSDAIFLGEVIAFESAGPGYYPGMVWVEFRVDRSWKGDPPMTTRLLTSESSASCGFPFAAGTRYLVYAFRGEWGPGPALWTHMCWRTHAYSAEDPDLVALGRSNVVEFRPPFPSPSSGDVAFDYTLGAKVPVELVIYDSGGRTVRTLFGPEDQEPGPHQLFWDGRDRAGRMARAGIYLAALTMGGQRYERRFALLR
jgi:flagellar hook capping protein FlgD